MNLSLLKDLQKFAKYLSVNELKNIKPEKLMAILHTDKATTKAFVQYLHDEGVLSYKYVFKCPNCVQECTAYERKLKKSPYCCNFCGDEISNATIIKKSWLIYNIDKNEMMNIQIENDVDLIEGTLNCENFVHIKDNIIDLNMIKENKMKIFIGSSKEAKVDMERLAIMIEESLNSVIVWDDPTVCVAGDFTLESLINVAHRVDAAIFVFNGEDETWYRGNIVQSVRDNVLLEYGLFAGVRGRENVIFMCKNKPKIATDLLGVTYLDAAKGDFSLKRDVNAWLSKIRK
ncbi:MULTISPECIES: TIR domain-containing protein [Clostridium]|uniref:Nucleotide-binding protein n=1 Tax=Clostridium frigoriphilum TaxID=443253 RepID=A0ABU7UW55_9CLOT|nr:nucleotide-binding protein [Clostridium sp. DSM 17811]MBU3101694.1 nucleotide-binding protein [Clostridium sp. DSM 17811]